MNERSRKKAFAIGALCVLAVLIIAVGTFWYFHPTYYKYNDRFILGNTAENITERYGEFSHQMDYVDGSLSTGSYLIKKANYSFFGNRFLKFYSIKFDKNGVAYAVCTEMRDWSYRENN